MVETTNQVTKQWVKKLSLKLSYGPRGSQGSIGSTTTFDNKWTNTSKTTNTKTTTTVLTPNLTYKCMCPSTAIQNQSECTMPVHTSSCMCPSTAIQNTCECMTHVLFTHEACLHCCCVACQTMSSPKKCKMQTVPSSLDSRMPDHTPSRNMSTLSSLTELNLLRDCAIACCLRSLRFPL